MKFYTFASMKRILSVRVSITEESSASAKSDASDVQSIAELSMFPLFPLFTPREELVKRILYIVSFIEPPVDETPLLLVVLKWENEAKGVFSESNQQLLSQKKNFTSLLMMILEQTLSEKLLHYVLLRLPTNFLPYLHQPLFLTDFLTDCYNYGGVLAVMALGGLFYLITQHNVNYPEYYPKLYELLTDDVFVLKWGLLQGEKQISSEVSHAAREIAAIVGGSSAHRRCVLQETVQDSDSELACHSVVCDSAGNGVTDVSSLAVSAAAGGGQGGRVRCGECAESAAWCGGRGRSGGVEAEGETTCCGLDR